jgi:hypothetical protein
MAWFSGICLYAYVCNGVFYAYKRVFTHTYTCVYVCVCLMATIIYMFVCSFLAYQRSCIHAYIRMFMCLIFESSTRMYVFLCV